MADIKQLEAALAKADAAGNTEDAKILADAIRQERAGAAAQTTHQPVPEMQRQWATGGPMQRAQMLMSQFGPRAKESLPSVQGIKDMGIEAGMAAGGQAAGIAMGPLAPVARPLLGAAGGALGNYLAQRQAVTRGEQEYVQGGRVVGAAIGGATGPGSAFKYAGSNVAATGVQGLMDNGQLPSIDALSASAAFGAMGKPVERMIDTGMSDSTIAASQKKAQDRLRQETIKAGKDLGYVLPPSLLTKVDEKVGTVAAALESVGGKAAIAQDAVHINQPITNNAVRQEFGISRFSDLDTKALDGAAKQYNDVYGEMAGLSPTAAIKMREFKQANADKSALFNAYRNPPSGQPKNPALLEQAKQMQADADFWFNELSDEAKKAGQPKLVDKFNEARVKLAQINLTKQAVSNSTGDVDASVFGDAFEMGEPLTGDFQKIGRFQSAFNREMREATKTPVSNVSQMARAFGPAMAGGAAFASGQGVPMSMALAGAGAFIPEYARAASMSRFMQNSTPNYGTAAPDFAAQFARMGTQAAGRNQNSFLKPPTQSNNAR